MVILFQHLPDLAHALPLATEAEAPKEEDNEVEMPKTMGRILPSNKPAGLG